jgi:hypothetical protein
MKWEGCGRKRSGIIVSYYSSICLEGLRKIRKSLVTTAGLRAGFGAHPVACTMGTGVLCPGVKRGRAVMLITHPHLFPTSRMSRRCTSSPPKCLHGMKWDIFSFSRPNIWRKSEIVKLLAHPPFTPCSKSQNILYSALSKTSSISVRSQISHP